MFALTNEINAKILTLLFIVALQSKRTGQPDVSKAAARCQGRYQINSFRNTQLKQNTSLVDLPGIDAKQDISKIFLFMRCCHTSSNDYNS